MICAVVAAPTPAATIRHGRRMKFKAAFPVRWAVALRRAGLLVVETERMKVRVNMFVVEGVEMRGGYDAEGD